MSKQRRAWLAPTLAGGGAALALVAALLAFLLIGRDDDTAGARTFTGDEAAAIAAAQTEVANVSSFRRAHFEADFTRALNGLTGDLATQFKQNKTVYKQTITKGKFDLVAKIVHTALVGRVDQDDVDGYYVLVTFNGYRSDQLTVPTAQQNMRVTIVKKSGKWLVADLQNIGVTGSASGSGSAAVPVPGASSGSARPSASSSSGR